MTDLTKQLAKMIAEGSDPRKFASGLADFFSVTKDEVLSRLDEIGLPDDEEMSLRYRSRVYGSYPATPISEHDEL